MDNINPPMTMFTIGNTGKQFAAYGPYTTQDEARRATVQHNARPYSLIHGDDTTELSLVEGLVHCNVLDYYLFSAGTAGRLMQYKDSYGFIEEVAFYEHP